MATKKTTPATRGATNKGKPTRAGASGTAKTKASAKPRAVPRARPSAKAAKKGSPAPPRKAKAVPRAATKSRASAHFTTDSPEAAFDHFLPHAEAVPGEGLEPCRADIALARANLERGLDALRDALPVVRKVLPKQSVEALLELPALGLALAHAAAKVERPVPAPEIEKRLAAMRPMREAALRQLEVFALLDLIPAQVPAAIRRGTGALDAAEDALTIPSVFQDNEELIGHRHPFTSAMLKKLGEDGAFLAPRLTQLEEAREAADRSPEADVLSRLWALLVERHEELRQVFAVLFGVKGLDAAIPPLGARITAPPAPNRPPIPA